MSQSINIERELNVLPIAPKIRQQLDELLASANEQEYLDKIIETLPPSKGTDQSAFVFLMILFAGFLLGHEREQPEKPVTDAFKMFWKQYVLDLPPSPEKSEAVLALYEQGELTHGQSARAMGLSRAEFLDELGRRGLSPFQYDADEVLAEAGLR